MLSFISHDNNNKGIDIFTSFIRSDMVWYNQDGSSLTVGDNSYDAIVNNSLDEIFNDDTIDVDIRCWYHVLGKRALQLNINKSIVREAIYYKFGRTYNRLLGVSNLALFMYYYYSYRTLNLSFEEYFDIIDGALGVSLNITDDLIYEMTNKFRLGIDRMIKYDV